MTFALLLSAALATETLRTYVNPVLPMDFSDPDVCTGADGCYYLTASSFGGLPGLPVLVSDDLVNWSYAGHALMKHPYPVYGDVPQHGKGVWAPSIRYRADKREYVIYWGDPDHGIYRVSAANPKGPWSEPRLVVEAKGAIDPCPLYDDDGRVYLVNAWAQSRAKLNSALTVRELDAEETKAVSEPVLVYDGIPDGNSTCEGPKFYKKDGEYWLFFPAGGVEQGWQVAARAKSPYGPYAMKTVLAQGKTDINGPHQGGVVEVESKKEEGRSAEYKFLHFRDRGAYGREVYLEPMTWQKGAWPVIGDNGEPVAKGTFNGTADQLPFGGLAVSDEFDEPALGPQWQFLGKSDDLMAWPTPNGYFRLYSTPLSFRGKGSFSLGDSPVNLWREPNLLVQKFPAESFTATLKAKISAKEDGEDAGLIVQGRSYARMGLRYVAKKQIFELTSVDCRDADQGKNEAKSCVLCMIPATVTPAGARSVQFTEIFLRMTVVPGETADGALAPTPRATFAWSRDGESWAAVDGDFAVAPGKWIGATVGIYAIAPHGCDDRGWIDLDWFRVTEE